MPSIPGFADQKLAVFKVTPFQNEALALARLGEYFVEMRRNDPAGLVGQALAEAFHEDPNAILARGSDLSDRVDAMYDISGWSLGLLWGADVVPVPEGVPLRVVGAEVEAAEPSGSLAESTTGWVLPMADPADVQAVGTLLGQGIPVELLDDGSVLVPAAYPWAAGHVAEVHGVTLQAAEDGTTGEVVPPSARVVGVAGTAFNSKVSHVRVLGRGGGYTSDIADGIIWASGGSVPGVPANQNPAEVINLSLGGQGSCGSTTQNAVNGAVSRGTTVVVAAGNSNMNVSGFTPANCSNVIAVAATDQNGSRASFSNYGSGIDVSAPGVGIMSTLNSGTTSPGSQSYASYNGTSMAAPHVAGVVALMQSAASSPLTPAQVESILKSTARALPGSCSGGCGAGIINAQAAVAAATGGGGGPDPDPDPGQGELQNGTPVTGIAGGSGSTQYWTINVPAGASSLQISTAGGSGDVDLYVRRGAQPTTSTYDCRPWRNGNNESCSFATPQSGTWHVMLRGYSSFSGVTLTGSYQAGGGGGGSQLQNGAPVTGLSGAANSERRYTFSVPAGAPNLSIRISGGSGDADLYVRRNAAPTTSTYDCRPWRSGNNETCSASAAAGGTYHVLVRGYGAYSGVTLTGSHD